MNLLRVQDMIVGEWYELDVHDSRKKRPVKVCFEILEKYTRGIISARVRYLDGTEDTINGLILGFSTKIEEPLASKFWKFFTKLLTLEKILPKKKYSLHFLPKGGREEDTVLKSDGYFHTLWYALYIFNKYALAKGHYIIFVESDLYAISDK